jgi:hypothetical protein
METKEKYEEIAMQIKSTYGISIPEDNVKKAYIVAAYRKTAGDIGRNVLPQDLVKAVKEANENHVWWYYEIEGVQFESWSLIEILCQTWRTEASVRVLELAVKEGLAMFGNELLISAISEISKYIPAGVTLWDRSGRIIPRAVQKNDHVLLTVLHTALNEESQVNQNIEKYNFDEKIFVGHISIDFQMGSVEALIRRIQSPYGLKHQLYNQYLFERIGAMMSAMELEKLKETAQRKVQFKEDEFLIVLATLELMKKIEVENRLK